MARAFGAAAYAGSVSVLAYALDRLRWSRETGQVAKRECRP